MVPLVVNHTHKRSLLIDMRLLPVLLRSIIIWIILDQYGLLITTYMASERNSSDCWQ